MGQSRSIDSSPENQFFIVFPHGMTKTDGGLVGKNFATLFQACDCWKDFPILENKSAIRDFFVLQYGLRGNAVGQSMQQKNVHSASDHA